MGNTAKVLPFRRPLEVSIECMDNLSYMRRLENESVNLILTSPPYNIGKTYEKKTTRERYVEEQAAAIAEAVRLLHPTGSICWQVGNHIDDGEVFPLDIVLYDIFKQHGLKLRNRIIWSFGHGLHCRKRFSGRHEAILWFTKGDDYTFNLDSIRIPSKYPNKKHFKGPNRGKISSHPLGKNPGKDQAYAQASRTSFRFSRRETRSSLYRVSWLDAGASISATPRTMSRTSRI